LKNKTNRRSGGSVTVWIRKGGPFDAETDQVLVGRQAFTGRIQPRRGGTIQIDRLGRGLPIREHRASGGITTGVLVEASDDDFGRLSGNGWAVGKLPPTAQRPFRLRRSFGFWPTQ